MFSDRQKQTNKQSNTHTYTHTHTEAFIITTDQLADIFTLYCTDQQHQQSVNITTSTSTWYVHTLK